jgi:hypothetical protein
MPLDRCVAMSSQSSFHTTDGGICRRLALSAIDYAIQPNACHVVRDLHVGLTLCLPFLSMWGGGTAPHAITYMSEGTWIVVRNARQRTTTTHVPSLAHGPTPYEIASQ